MIAGDRAAEHDVGNRCPRGAQHRHLVVAQPKAQYFRRFFCFEEARLEEARFCCGAEDAKFAKDRAERRNKS